ncbi:MAG: ABC transporter permease, partial [Devosia sp.]|nr:ABC transporter permease [Devosia sp.]
MRLSRRFKQNLTSASFIVAVFVTWEIACIVFRVSPIVLPQPSAIVRTLVVNLPALWPHILQTLATTMVGFALGTIIGVALGALVGISRAAYNVAYPLLVGFSSVPKVAVVPIFVLWFGSGTVPAILTALTTCIFPIVVNVATGLATTEP